MRWLDRGAAPGPIDGVFGGCGRRGGPDAPDFRGFYDLATFRLRVARTSKRADDGVEEVDTAGSTVEQGGGTKQPH
jgi:hypothetical protein